MAVNAIPISAYYDLVFPDSMLRSQCAISDTIFYNLSLQTHLRDSNCDQSALRSAAPRDALCAPSSPSADAPLPFPLNIKDKLDYFTIYVVAVALGSLLLSAIISSRARESCPKWTPAGRCLLRTDEKGHTPKTQLTQRVSDEWNEEH